MPGHQSSPLPADDPAGPARRPVELAVRVYAGLLLLMPAEFRARYRELAAQAFRDLCAEEVLARGRTGLIRVCWRALPDLLVGTVREWGSWLSRSADGRPPKGARLAASALPASGALLVVYSQVRYPADLARPGYAGGYAVLLGLLAILAARFLVSRDAWPVPVACALGTAPGWLLALRLARPGAGTVALLPIGALLVVACVWQAARAPGALAGARTGAVTGALAGLVLLVVNVVDGLATMGTAGRDAVYVNEFVHSGQPSLAAYVIGERIGGGGYGLLCGAAAGALIGLAAGTVAVLIRRRPYPG